MQFCCVLTMPVQYTIDGRNHLVRTTFNGVVTDCDVFEHASRLRNEPAFEPDFSELADLTGATEVRMSYADFQRLEFADPFSSEAKRAFVVPTGTHIYGLTRMFHGMRGHSPRIQIFASVEDGLAWLGE